MRCQGVLKLRDEKSGLKVGGSSGWIDCKWGAGGSGHTTILVFAKWAWDGEACKDEAEGRKRRREQKSKTFAKDRGRGSWQLMRGEMRAKNHECETD